MRISKLRVREFLSLKDTSEVTLDPSITLLLGKNENGKTNLLVALASFDREAQYQTEDLCRYGEARERVARGDLQPSEIPIVTLWFTLDSKDKRRLADIDRSLSEAVELEVTKHFDNHYAAKAILSDGGSADLGDERWAGAARVQEIIDALGPALATLDGQLEAHVARHPPFAESLQTFRGAVHAFEAEKAEVTSPADASAATADLRQQITALPNQDEPIQIDIAVAQGEIDRIEQQLVDADVAADQTQRRVLEMLPRFVYYDDVNLLEDEVNIDQFLADPAKSTTLANLVALASLDVARLHEQSVFEREAATELASTEITGHVNKSWTQERVSVTLNADGTTLFVVVKDETGGHDRPSERSKGFQWYLGFYINFNAGSESELSNTVLLLDDPGVHLHPSGQKDLLKTIGQLAKSNQFVIATHSPFMIDREHLERIRIVARRGERQGTKLKEKWHESEQDAFEPIRAALGLTIGDSLFSTLSNVIVEGMSDYWILSGMNRVCGRLGEPHLNHDDVAILPVGGASKVPYWASLVFKQKLKVAALLDEDEQGRKAYKVMINDLGMDDRLLTTLKAFATPPCTDVQLEDLVDSDFYHQGFEAAYGSLLLSKKVTVKRDDLSAAQCSRTKPYEELFKKKDLGTFDKVAVGKAIHDICADSATDETVVGADTVANFARLLEQLGEMLESGA